MISFSSKSYKNVTFTDDGIVSYQPIAVQGLVSGLNLSTDVLLNYSPKRQHLKDVRIDGSLVVTNRINVEHTLNGMNYAKMTEFATSSGRERPLHVEVQGNVHFQLQPEVGQLNGFHLEQLHRDVWLTNRDEVLTGAYRFDNVHFASYVHTKVKGEYLFNSPHNYDFDFVDLGTGQSTGFGGNFPNLPKRIQAAKRDYAVGFQGTSGAPENGSFWYYCT